MRPLGLLDAAKRLAANALGKLAERVRLELPADPYPDTWREIVARNVPLSATLADTERERLMRIAQLFLLEIPMEGCAGLEIDDEIRVTIAATASLLLLNVPYPRFPRVKRVLVYPDTYVAVRPAFGPDADDDSDDDKAPTAGEAWMNGMIVLSWSDVLEDANDRQDGSNVVLHEFAHVLDAEDGHFDGMPLLEGVASPDAWADEIRDQLAGMRRAIAADEDVPIDDYAATDAGELFAVATETFFERPTALREHAPALYAQLARYYRQDPAAR